MKLNSQQQHNTHSRACPTHQGPFCIESMPAACTVKYNQQMLQRQWQANTTPTSGYKKEMESRAFLGGGQDGDRAGGHRRRSPGQIDAGPVEQISKTTSIDSSDEVVQTKHSRLAHFHIGPILKFPLLIAIRTSGRSAAYGAKNICLDGMLKFLDGIGHRMITLKG